MDADEALEFVESLIAGSEKQLNNFQRDVFRGAWQNKTYSEIHSAIHEKYPHGVRCDIDYIMRDLGFELWKLLSEVLGEKVSKNKLHGAVERAYKKSIAQVDNTRTVTSSIAPLPVENEQIEFEADVPLELTKHQRWFPPSVFQFCGRLRDLEHLEHLIRLQGCRLLTLSGVGGIGKTALAAQLGQRVWDQFDVRIWRSLHDAPSLAELLAELTHFLSNGQETSTEIARLLHYLVHQHCLIVLDGLETVLQSGVHDGSYREGYAAYGELLEHIAKRTAHQSCLIITSREQPREAGIPHRLQGLGEVSGRELLQAKAALSGSDQDWRTLIWQCDGNPYALEVIATAISELFDGNIASFFRLLGQDAILDEIQGLFDEQFGRLSVIERQVVSYLTNQSEPATFQDIQYAVPRSPTDPSLLSVLSSLRRRSLIEARGGHYFLAKLVRRYARSCL